MNSRNILLFSIAIITNSTLANVDASFKDAIEFAESVNKNGQSIQKNFNPNTTFENFNNSPEETKYYDDPNKLTEDGFSKYQESDVGKTITNSIINNPPLKLSLDAPFLETGFNAQKNAEFVTDENNLCSNQTINKIEYKQYTCNQDININQFCTRTAKISAYWDIKYGKTQQIAITDFTYKKLDNNRIGIYFTPMASGKIQKVILYTSSLPGIEKVSLYGNIYKFFDTNVVANNKITEFLPKNYEIHSGIQEIAILNESGKDAVNHDLNILNKKRAFITLLIEIQDEIKTWIPTIIWENNCSIPESGVFLETVCTQPKEERKIIIEGVEHSVYSDCWEYKDKYLLQEGTEGTCKPYIDDPACNEIKKQCSFYSDEGYCVNQDVIYECEKVSPVEGIMCGGKFFCSDGSCYTGKNEQSNDFKQAASGLAALQEIGEEFKDAEPTVRAFTGKQYFCRKDGIGYSNCCKDSGWGNDIGLAKCNSEEKALGTAKEKKLVIGVGEFCAKKTLGKCLRKKRSYCVFDSKLAKIIQEQGRKWQLKKSFGNAKNPDCSGVTIEQLQLINFDLIDFHDFYDELESRDKFPGKDELINTIKDNIKNHYQEDK